MDRKTLDRYKRILLGKRGEMSVATAETESPIPAAGGQRGDPVDQANADAEAELQIHLHQPMAAFSEQSKRHSLESDMERLVPARPVEIQFLGLA